MRKRLSVGFTWLVSVKGGSCVPQRVSFVEELSELLTESLPDLWKLGQAYFNRALITDVCIFLFLAFVILFIVLIRRIFYFPSQRDVF